MKTPVNKTDFDDTWMEGLPAEQVGDGSGQTYDPLDPWELEFGHDEVHMTSEGQQRVWDNIQQRLNQYPDPEPDPDALPGWWVVPAFLGGVSVILWIWAAIIDHYQNLLQ